MEIRNYHNLLIWTSYVTPYILESFIKKDVLPIFIARNISNSGLIGKWNGTSVHFSSLAPSPKLLRDWKKDKIIDTEEFIEKFTKEIKDNVNLEEVLKRISFLCDVCGAKGAVLMGYGQDRKECHRSILSDIINNSGLLNNKVVELVI